MHKLKLLILLGLWQVPARAEHCQIPLAPEKARQEFLAYLGNGVALVPLTTQTPLETSAYLRRWKSGLAARLNLGSTDIEARYRRRGAAFREHLPAGWIALGVAYSGNGPKLFVINDFDLDQQLLSYYLPNYAKKVFTTVAYPAGGTLHLVGLEDLLHLQPHAGDVIGTILLKIPGLNL